MTLKVLDLFSGIGGFSLGLERTGGFETVAFCEIEEYPRRVLAKHWPGVPIYDDVRTLTAERLTADGIAVDVITGGFPCQDISVVGKQAGINAERSGLWSEIVRLAGDLRPRFIIVENVANLLAGPREKRGAWFGRVLGDLARLGYDAEWENIPAGAVGAPHRRERVWVVAYPCGTRRPGLVESLNSGPSGPWGVRSAAGVFSGDPFVPGDSWPKPLIRRMDDGVPNRMDRLRGIGNAVVPQIPEIIGRAILNADETHSRRSPAVAMAQRDAVAGRNHRPVDGVLLQFPDGGISEGIRKTERVDQ